MAVLEHPERCLAMSNISLPNGYSNKIHNFTDDVNNVTQMELEIVEKMDEYKGKQCTLCTDMCPIQNPLSSIAMIDDIGGGKKPEIYDGCIGCGVCQEVCPTSIPSIVVKPRVSYDEYYNKA